MALGLGPAQSKDPPLKLEVTSMLVLEISHIPKEGRL